MVYLTSQMALRLLIISLLFLNGCGARTVLDTPQAAITTVAASPTAPLISTSTFVSTAVTVSTGAITIATLDQSTTVDNITPTATQTSIPPNSTAPTFTSQAVACVTSQIDPEALAEVQADTLIFSSTTLGLPGQKLPLASGLKIAFSDMRSFEVKQVSEDPPRITVEIIHLNGDTIIENVPVYNSVDAHLEGKAKNGDFWLYLAKVQKVEFQPQQGCQ